MLITSIYYFIFALIFAFLEIEIEGKYGWAARLPTWKSSGGIFEPILKIVFKRPVTGYHFFMIPFIFVSLHSIFFLTRTWNILIELQILIFFLNMLVVEDFLWFILNPYFGIKNFKKEKIWWHRQSVWLFNLIPIDYAWIVIISIIIAIGSFYFSESSYLITSYLYYFEVQLIGLLLVYSLLVPVYHRWYRYMRNN